MSEYYRLKDNFVLRGWEEIPYILIQRPENRPFYLNKSNYDALSLCDGNYDLSMGIIPQDVKKTVKEMEKEGIVEQCPRGTGLSEDQKYRRYENRFISAVHWSITGKCNYRCKHCFLSAPEAKFGELDHETVMDLIDQMADCGILTADLTGGEPLVRSDFWEIIDALLDHHIMVTQIYTNGKLVTKELLDGFIRRGIKPQFIMSYDGDDGWHDWLRGIKDAGKFVLDAFDLCYEMGFPTGSAMCLHKGNIGLLRQSVNTLAAHHVGYCKVGPVSTTELWERYGKDYTLTFDELFGAYVEYAPHYFEDGAPINLELCGLFTCGKGSDKWRCPAVRYDGSNECLNHTVCEHARSELYLSPDGRMLPCMSLTSYDVQYDYPLATEIGLKQGLTESTYMSLIDTRISEFFEINRECGTCPYAKVCAGGCRADALVTEGQGIMDPNRACCAVFKEGWGRRMQEALKGIAQTDDPAFE